MDFEDYKKQFEILTKIDTPEKLILCERLYKQHLLALEDENYFEPVDENSDDGINRLYEKNLKLALGLEQIKKKQISFLTMPSFEPESLLIIDNCNDRFVLTYTVLVSNYWKTFYADNKITSVEKTTSSVELDKEIGNEIFNLVYKIISEARPTQPGRIVLDGIKYFLSCATDGKVTTVFKHSPSETSKSAKIIEILELLTHNLKAFDDKTLKDIKTKIDHIDKYGH